MFIWMASGEKGAKRSRFVAEIGEIAGRKGCLGVAVQLLEIRLGPRVLLLARPGALPPMVLRASDAPGLRAALADLACDRLALNRLRAGWSSLVPAANSQQLDRIDLTRELRQRVMRGQIAAALLDPRAMAPVPAEINGGPAVRLVVLQLGEADVVIAPRGALPGLFNPLLDRDSAANLLQALRPDDTALARLREGAALFGTSELGKIDTIRQIVIARLRQGTLDGAVMRLPAHRAMAANAAGPQRDIGSMDDTDKVGEAMLRASPHLADDVAKAWAEMTTKKNLAIMAGSFVALALAQLYPPAGLAIDAIVFITASFTIGWKSVDLLKALIEATMAAMRARNEEDLDKAGRLYADAADALGAIAIAALTARFAGKKVGQAMEDRAAAAKASTANRNPSPASKPLPPPQEAAPTRSKPPLTPQQQELAKLEALHASAAENQKALAEVGKSIASETGSEFKNPGVKELARVKEKFINENYSEASEIKDISRAGFIVEDKQQADLIVQKLGSKFKIARDKGWKTLDSGYTDRKLIVEYPDGTVGEIQIIPKPIAEYKVGAGHKNYDFIRNNPGTPEAESLLQQDKATYGNLLKGSPFE